jgi:hypothetical protein
MTSPIRGGGTYYPPNQPIYQPGPGYYPQNQPAYFPSQPPNQGYRAAFYPPNQTHNMQTRVPLQDPDEAFTVTNPPPYSEIVKEQKP